MEKFRYFYEKKWLLTSLFCIVYIFLNILFYPTIWSQLLHTDERIFLVQGETPVYEFAAELVRQNVLQGKNPFLSTDRVLYPVGWNISMEDVAPINGFYFLLLRPFLSIHHSFILIMVLSVFLSNISMYGLLRQLKIRRSVAFLTGLIFGFTPFVSHRMAGHPTYVSLYLFVLPAISLVMLYNAKNRRDNTIAAVLLAISGVILLLTNLYFLIMFMLLGGLLFVLFFLFDKHTVLNFIIQKWLYLVASGLVVLILLFPWLMTLKESMQFNPRSVPESFVDNIAFSSDIFAFFWPKNNVLYWPILQHLPYKPFMETLAYPGILLLIAVVLFWKYRDKFHIRLMPLYISALVFAVLTLGPYLKIATHQTHIPLPYMVIHYLPYFQMARAPGRFIVPVVVLISIIFAFVLQYLLKKYKSKNIHILIAVFCIFLIDQRVHINTPFTFALPTKIYAYLDAQPKTPLLEIPFTIRDGLKNHGHLHSVWSVEPQFQHNHPLFGIYAGRVPDPTFVYFQNHPFFGIMGQAISIDNLNPAKTLAAITPQVVRSTADFYNIRYILIKDKELFTNPVKQKLVSEYHSVMVDNGYTLLKRNTDKRTIYTTIHFAKPDVIGQLQEGWSNPEPEGRWAMGASSTIFLNGRSTSKTLRFVARTHVPDQELTIYFNKKKIAELSISPEKKSYEVSLSGAEIRDVNTILLHPSRIVSPNQIDPKNADTRSLSIFFQTIQLQ